MLSLSFTFSLELFALEKVSCHVIMTLKKSYGKTLVPKTGGFLPRISEKLRPLASKHKSEPSWKLILQRQVSVQLTMALAEPGTGVSCLDSAAQQRGGDSCPSCLFGPQ